MKQHNAALTITALHSVLLATFHVSDDIVLGIEPGGVSNFKPSPCFLQRSDCGTCKP